jgi:hypothetical protein
MAFNLNYYHFRQKLYRLSMAAGHNKALTIPDGAANMLLKQLKGTMQ